MGLPSRSLAHKYLVHGGKTLISKAKPEPLCAHRAVPPPAAGAGRRYSQQHPKMKVIAAYLLAVLGGNANPSAGDLKDIFGSGFHLFHPSLHPFSDWLFLIGAEADDDKIEFLLSEVEGKDITELIASGREKFACVPSGGGGVVAAAAPAAGAGGAAPAAAEAKKEEKVEEKEESDEDMGFSLFD
ncbi:hypothetical protein Taro_044464 [Colocasia esculenta]|uniref:60S acidic ribosomal protein P2 n=1 Tax=Colocasia esculenta TaxID=4460 RepID=A0A843WYE1_COLES|nr:hypothetical protein [Colocasia esculenta]